MPLNGFSSRVYLHPALFIRGFCSRRHVRRYALFFEHVPPCLNLFELRFLIRAHVGVKLAYSTQCLDDISSDFFVILGSNDTRKLVVGLFGERRLPLSISCGCCVHDVHLQLVTKYLKCFQFSCLTSPMHKSSHATALPS